MRYLFLLFFFVAPLGAVETIQLTTTVTQAPPTTNLQVTSLTLNWGAAKIQIALTDGTNIFNFSYSGTTATNLMIALNKANLSTTSLQKRIIQQLVTDGYISGTISGLPD